MCFVCEDELKEVELLGKKPCPGCGGELPEQPQRLLMGAHVLFDPKITATLEPCGLCLRPAQCMFYLRKEGGAKWPANQLQAFELSKYGAIDILNC